jgi:hypothetical protein
MEIVLNVGFKEFSKCGLSPLPSQINFCSAVNEDKAVLKVTGARIVGTIARSDCSLAS